MPADIITKHPVWPISLAFTERTHKYVDSFGHQYISVTTLTKQFCEPFDAVGISQAMARRDPSQSPEAIRAGWRAKSQAACKHGTRVHEYAEWLFSGRCRGKQHHPESDLESGAQKAVAAIYRDLIESGRYQYVGAEMAVFCPLRRVAGTLDLALRHVETGDIWLVDWKTNREIKREGYNGKRMEAPLEHLQDCSFEQYSLQLAIYWEILRTACWLPLEGPRNARIIWIDPAGQPQIIEPADRVKEARLLLNWNYKLALEVAQ